MDWTLIIIIIGSSLFGVSKAISDTVQHFDIWSSSVFAKALESSFWGPKDKTWIRKDNTNKIINWLLHYPLVFVTDIWHFSNMITSLSYLPVFVSIYYTQSHIFIILSLFYITRSLIFNLFYHLILKTK